MLTSHCQPTAGAGRQRGKIGKTGKTGRTGKTRETGPPASPVFLVAPVAPVAPAPPSFTGIEKDTREQGYTIIFSFQFSIFHLFYYLCRLNKSEIIKS